MGEVFLDAFIDALKVLPVLLIMNFLIELLEYRSNGLKANKILKGGAAPLIGTAVGVLPQCGFSVVATELYAKRRIALGTLLAVYIVTSDEALPIMLSSYEGVVKVLPLLIIKIVFALIVGYSVFGIECAVNAKKRECGGNTHKHDEKGEHAEHEHACENAHISENSAENTTHEHMHEHAHGDEDDVQAHIHGCHHHALDGEDTPSENLTKKQKAARIWRLYIKHPLLHTATVLFFIFVVNVLFGTAVYFVGEDKIAEFIGSTGYFQPVLAAIVGLIPNCAGSVVITELYVVGGLNLGGAVGGLAVSAGIGYAVLIKQNRPVRNTALVIALMFVLSVAAGLAVNGVTGAMGLNI